MQIEKIEPSKHKAGRILIFLSDGSLVKASEQELLDFHLYKGKELTAEELEALQKTAASSGARARGAAIVGARALSKESLRRRLVEKGETPEDAEAAADWLEEIGAVDDGAYAAILVRHYGAMGYGPRRLREKLYENHIPRDLWDEALAEAPENSIQLDHYIAGKLRGREPDDRELKRLTDALARRGFAWGEIRDALRRYGTQREEFND